VKRNDFDSLSARQGWHHRGTFGDPRGVTAQNDTIKKVYMVGNVGVSQAATQQGNMIINEVAAICTTENINGVTNVMQKVREVGKKRSTNGIRSFRFSLLLIILH
jgi:hypothetical protein